MPADESTVGILFEIYELLLIIIRVYQKLKMEFVPFVVVTTIVVVGGWPRVGSVVVVAASLYLCLPCIFGRELVNFVLLQQRPGTIGIVWTSSMDYVEVALTTCRSNNQLSI
jgi:hypothetical protein